MLNGLFWILCLGAEGVIYLSIMASGKAVYQQFRQWRNDGIIDAGAEPLASARLCFSSGAVQILVGHYKSPNPASNLIR